MPDEHTHTGSSPHEHEGDTPGHSHDATAAPPPPATATAAVDVGPTPGGLSLRIILTLVGAAAIIGGAFLNWFNFGDVPEGIPVPEGAGVDMNWSIFYDTGDPFGASFFTSAGFVAILLGLLAVLGMALRTGWLSRLAGALAIVAIVLYAITLYRVPEADLSFSEIGLGAWLVLAGGIIVVVGGFLGSRRIVSANVPAAPAA
jgi:hypothetical protein